MSGRSVDNTPSIVDALANLPASASPNTVFVAADGSYAAIWNGSAWVVFGGGGAAANRITTRNAVGDAVALSAADVEDFDTFLIGNNTGENTTVTLPLSSTLSRAVRVQFLYLDSASSNMVFAVTAPDTLTNTFGVVSGAAWCVVDVVAGAWYAAP